MSRDHDATGEYDPTREYDESGVDRTLVRAMLDLAPAERARSHDRLLAAIELLAAAGRAARDERA